METANKLELHYYFNDNSHTMDALIRNKCEAELLALINEVKNSLGFDFSLDAEALREGGLINKWKALGENQAQIQIILTIILIIIGLATLYQSKDDEIDSDVDPAGKSTCIRIEAGVINCSYDAGIFNFATLGDFVWHDRNGDGIQAAGEEGIANVRVLLYDAITNTEVK